MTMSSILPRLRLGFQLARARVMALVMARAVARTKTMAKCNHPDEMLDIFSPFSMGHQQLFSLSYINTDVTIYLCHIW